MKPDREKLNEDPNLYLQTVIKEYVSSSPTNRLPKYNNEPVVDEPLVGFANGDDAIFKDYKDKNIIGNFHLLPKEAMLSYLWRQGKSRGEKEISSLSVISVVFTDTLNTRLSNRQETSIASPRWQSAYYRGFVLLLETLDYIVTMLEELGYQSVAPLNVEPNLFLWDPHGGGPTIDWSERHAAYAAGLGTFGLNSDLITPRGLAVQCGSVITDLLVPPTLRIYDNHYNNCLYYQNGSCQQCVRRCPSGAISKQGYNKMKCFNYHEIDLVKISKDLGRAIEPGETHPLCALCMTKVPCEDRIPPAISAKLSCLQ